jgi:hypothetical protein
VNLQTGPCDFAEPGLAPLQAVHGGPLAWVELACLHGHTESGWGCALHLAEARGRLSRAGSVRCERCGHACPVALRVPATGEAAGLIPWPGVTDDTKPALRNVDYRHLQEVPVRRQMSISDHDRSRQAMGHDSAAYLLGFAVEDGIITDEQRLALLERWLPWGDRQLTAGCEQSREDAQRIRREQGQGPS